MKKLSLNLPNISTLLMQKQTYKSHMEKLQHISKLAMSRSKSSYQFQSNSLKCKAEGSLPLISASVTQIAKEIRKHKNSNKNSSPKLSPYQRKKQFQRSAENNRLRRLILHPYKSLESRSHALQDFSLHAAYKNRLVKFSLDHSTKKVHYKYQKSIKQLQKYRYQVQKHKQEEYRRLKTDIQLQEKRRWKSGMTENMIKKGNTKDLICQCLEEEASYSEVNPEVNSGMNPKMNLALSPGFSNEVKELQLSHLMRNQLFKGKRIKQQIDRIKLKTSIKRLKESDGGGDNNSLSDVGKRLQRLLKDQTEIEQQIQTDNLRINTRDLAENKPKKKKYKSISDMQIVQVFPSE